MSAPSPAPFLVVLTGNPNCGKTTLFNSLTGLRGKVGNYAGVTVERKEGALIGVQVPRPVQILDLPGTYSLSPQSLDEQIARDILFQRLPDVPAPDLVVIVIDASNLQRNLYYATQVLELGYPTLVALNMMDVAQENGMSLDLPALSQALGAPVLPLIASAQTGVEDLRSELVRAVTQGASTLQKDGGNRQFLELPEPFGREVEKLLPQLKSHRPNRPHLAAVEAVLWLSDDQLLTGQADYYPAAIRESVAAARQRLETAQIDWRSASIEARYARVLAIQQHVITETAADSPSFSDRLDTILTHRIWGLLILVSVMGLLFVSIFWLAQYPMDAIEVVIAWLATQVSTTLPPGDFNDLLTKGVITGVGSIVVFLPQILLLFLFISLLEDSGYMSRAAFLMDRLMSRVGLHGKSFIPMLSSDRKSVV